MEAMRLMDQKEIKTDTSQEDSTSRLLLLVFLMTVVTEILTKANREKAGDRGLEREAAEGAELSDHRE